MDAPRAAAPARIGSVRTLHGTREDYLRALQERFAELDLAGVDVVLDCANGATYRAAPEIFRRLGAARDRARRRARRAQHQRRLRLDAHRRARRARCATGGHDIGFAFDGDGDRLLAVDRDGRARRRRRAHRARRAAPARAGPPARRRRRRDGHDELRLPHGDARRRHARSRRRRSATATCSRSCARAAGASAASSPGHIIDMGFVPSGDGIASALLTLEALAGARPRRPRRDGQAAAAARQRPRRRSRRGDGERRAGRRRPSARRAALEGRGRVLVRPSGTEQLVRVMVEAPTDEETEAVCAGSCALVEAQSCQAAAGAPAVLLSA